MMEPGVAYVAYAACGDVSMIWSYARTQLAQPDGESHPGPGRTVRRF